MFKYSIGSIFLSILFTLILVIIFKEMKIYIAMGAAGLTGWLLSIWFIRKEKRIPTSKERNWILGVYGAGMAMLFILLAFASSKVTGAGIIIVALTIVVYPGFLSIVFNEKTLDKELEKFNAKTSNVET